MRIPNPAPLSDVRIAILVVVGVTALTLAPVLNADFVNWDDTAYVLNNRAVAEFDVAALLCHPYVGNYHPLTMLSHAVDRRLWGLDARGHHLGNWLVHLATAVLVLLLARELLGAGPAALAAALLWAVHPLKVEPVAWVSQRKELLCGVFYMASLWAYVRYVKQARARWLVWAGVCFVLGLLAKPTAVTLPLVWVLLDDFLGRGVNRRTLLEKAPFVGLSVLAGLAALAAQHGAQAVRWEEAGRLPLAGVCWNVGFYLQQFAAPVRLSAIYPMQLHEALSGWQVAGGVVVAAALAGMAIVGRRWSRVWTLGCGMFLIALAPMVGLAPLGRIVAADRYMYIPSLGLVLLAGAFLKWLGSRSGAAGRATGVVAVAAIALLAWRSAERTQVWQDSPRLWASVIDVFPDCATAWNNLGDFHAHTDEPAKALACFEQALRAQPDHAHAHFNAGSTLARLQRWPAAADHYREARRLWPTRPDLQQRIDAQLARLEKAASTRPGRAP